MKSSGSSAELYAWMIIAVTSWRKGDASVWISENIQASRVRPKRAGHSRKANSTALERAGGSHSKLERRDFAAVLEPRTIWPRRCHLWQVCSVLVPCLVRASASINWKSASNFKILRPKFSYGDDCSAISFSKFPGFPTIDVAVKTKWKLFDPADQGTDLELIDTQEFSWTRRPLGCQAELILVLHWSWH